MKFISETDWDDLLESVSKNTLTPFIGKEIFNYQEDPGGSELLSFDTYLSKKLLEKFGVTDCPAQTLTDTVHYLINENEKTEEEDIIDNLKPILENIKFNFPLLTDLLRISDLKFFVNTTVFYDILKRKIEVVRKEKDSDVNKNEKEADYIDFSPTSKFSFVKDPKLFSKTFVFNVFGSFNTDPAISEELMVEFTSEFGETLKNTDKLAENFRGNNLLFLGCTYPEWMTRFILRLLTDQAIFQWGDNNFKPRRKIFIINDKSPYRDEQIKILKYYGVVTFEGSNKEFISELLKRWKTKYAKPKLIFLSYTRDDQQFVEKLKTGLEQAGNIECFVDTTSIEPADRWREEIILKIDKADLFIPLLSNNSLEHKGFVEKEWDYAVNRYIAKGKNDVYIMPVVIDATDRGDKRIPKEFAELNISGIPEGKPDETFLNKIKKTLSLE